MRCINLVLLFFFLSNPSNAENTPIIKCHVKNSEWNATLILDSIGAGFLKMKNLKSQQVNTCGLRIDHMSDGQRSIVPEVKVYFGLGGCDPELGIYEKEILKDLVLIIETTKKDKPEGRVQWLRTKQPEACVVEKLSMFEVSLNSKRWLEGTWGRKTASEPKSGK